MNYLDYLISSDIDENETIPNDIRTSYEIQIAQIIDYYFNNKMLSKEQIEKLTNDFDFQENLLIYIQKKMKNIMTDSSVLLYKELIIVINLLSQGQKFEIFDQYNEYSRDAIEKLFRVYEKNMAENANTNSQKFELQFKYYMTLLDAYNELCLINLIDVVRKKSITMFVDAITESINLLKFSVPLDETKLQQLNAFQGKLLINFSYMSDMDVKSENSEEIIRNYGFILNKISDGYYLASSFTNLYKLKTYVVLLSCLKRLGNLEEHDIKLLEPLFTIYFKALDENPILFESFSASKEYILEKYMELSIEKINSSDTKHLIITLLQEEEFGSYCETVYVMVNHLDELSSDVLVFILKHLLQSSRLRNDYHEYFKLMIVDTVINRLIEMQHLESIEQNHSFIDTYIEKFNIASHLMTAFSKIYLSLSMYYALRGENYLKESQRLYYKSEKICSYTMINEEYKGIYHNILVNHAKSFLSETTSILRLPNDELIALGEKMMRNFFSSEKVRIYFVVNKKIEKIIEKVFTTNDYDKEKLLNKVEKIISEEIFFGLAECSISKEAFNKSVDDIGYEYLEDELIESYKITYKYSYVYNESFNVLYKKNSEYIKNKINGFLAALAIKKPTENILSEYLYDDDELVF